MGMARPAAATTAESLSAVEYTAATRRPSSRHARATRSAISPRLAIRTVSKPDIRSPAVNGRQQEQPLAVLDRGTVVLEHPDQPAGLFEPHRDHQLHRLDDPDLGAGREHVALAREGFRAGLRAPVEDAHHRRADRGQPRVVALAAVD